eukprot:9505383-Alexandrium_andersonii.AAC.1
MVMVTRHAMRMILRRLLIAQLLMLMFAQMPLLIKVPTCMLTRMLLQALTHALVIMPLTLCLLYTSPSPRD